MRLCGLDDDAQLEQGGQNRVCDNAGANDETLDITTSRERKKVEPLTAATVTLCNEKTAVVLLSR